MPVTVALVGQFNNHLRYLATSDASGGTFALPSAGGATPDLQTDSLAGGIKAISRAQVAGIGNIAAGVAVTQGQARALLLSDASVSVGGPAVPRAITSVSPRSGVAVWSVDANQLAGNPSVAITATAAVGTAYIDIEISGAIGA